MRAVCVHTCVCVSVCACVCMSVFQEDQSFKLAAIEQLCMYMYTCIFMCMYHLFILQHVHTYVCMFDVCIYVCVCVCVWMDICRYVCICTHLCLNVCMYACMCV